jgi:hypothetical protein
VDGLVDFLEARQVRQARIAADLAVGVEGATPGNEEVNAAFVVGGGAGVRAETDDVGAIVESLRERGALPAMGRNARRLVRRRAACAVVDVAIDLSRRRSARRESA